MLVNGEVMFCGGCDRQGGFVGPLNVATPLTVRAESGAPIVNLHVSFTDPNGGTSNPIAFDADVRSLPQLSEAAVGETRVELFERRRDAAKVVASEVQPLIVERIGRCGAAGFSGKCVAADRSVLSTAVKTHLEQGPEPTEELNETMATEDVVVTNLPDNDWIRKYANSGVLLGTISTGMSVAAVLTYATSNSETLERTPGIIFSGTAAIASGCVTALCIKIFKRFNRPD